jgi:glycopeptide antibiotics resistance protein
MMFGVYNSVSVIITVLKLVTKKRLVKTENFYVCCDYSYTRSV